IEMVARMREMLKRKQKSTLPLREGRKILSVAKNFSGRGKGSKQGRNDPSPKFVSLRFTNFDPPSRGGWNSNRPQTLPNRQQIREFRRAFFGFGHETLAHVRFRIEHA